MSLEESQLSHLKEMLLCRSGLTLGQGKSYLVEARLSRLARERDLDVGGLLEWLAKTPHGPVHDRVVELMSTYETSFFRDWRPFEVLRDHVIPTMIEARAETRKLSIWSAACSTGQEIASVAMLLEEEFPKLASWNVSLVGTDLSPEAIGRARTGRYGQLEVNRGLPAKYLVRYFQREGAEWTLSEAIRSRIELREMNLLEPWVGLPTPDVVLMRNVLIYLEPDTKSRILERVAGHMAPDGFLLLGSAETTLGLVDHFETDRSFGTSCYQLRSRRTASFPLEAALEATLLVWNTSVGLEIEVDPGGDFRPERIARVMLRGKPDRTVTLACARSLAEEIARRLFGQEAGEIAEEDVRDAMAELANMLGGGMKGVLPGASQLGLPLVFDDADVWDAGSGRAVEMRFRCGRRALRVRVGTEG